MKNFTKIVFSLLISACLCGFVSAMNSAGSSDRESVGGVKFTNEKSAFVPGNLRYLNFCNNEKLPSTSVSPEQRPFRTPTPNSTAQMPVLSPPQKREISPSDRRCFESEKRNCVVLISSMKCCNIFYSEGSWICADLARKLASKIEQFRDYQAEVVGCDAIASAADDDDDELIQKNFLMLQEKLGAFKSLCCSKISTLNMQLIEEFNSRKNSARGLSTEEQATYRNIVRQLKGVSDLIEKSVKSDATIEEQIVLMTQACAILITLTTLTTVVVGW